MYRIIFYNASYCSMYYFLLLAVMLSILILSLSVALASRHLDKAKVAAYECGFDPFDDARNPFDVQFYLVAVLFLLFDIEAMFLYPWVTTIGISGSLNFWIIFDFLLELVVGYCYGWRVGAFNF